MTEQDRGNFETIIEAFGNEAQMIVAIEELSELQKEITKKLRHKKGTVFGLVEEIADVEIMTSAKRSLPPSGIIKSTAHLRKSKS